MRIRLLLPVLGVLLLSACGGGGSARSGSGTDGSGAKDDAGVTCDGQCVTATSRLSVADVKRVLAQAIDQANTLGVKATIAVVDRVGNVLAVHRMANSGPRVEISSTYPNTVSTGLDGVVLPAGSDGDALAAIAKAITGAFLSSEGNAFSTRTANQIIQENLNPGELFQPSGPLFGVQFSQLPCSDFASRFDGSGPSPGPHRSPLGLAADPGGFPLFRGGTPIGGVGVIADGRYTLDKVVSDTDRDIDEQIALAATFGFGAPVDRRADTLTVEGKNLRWSDVEFDDLPSSPEQAPAYDSLVGQGQLIAVNGYSNGQLYAGTVFGQPASGIVPAGPAFAGQDAFIFVDENGVDRYPPRAGLDGDDLAVEPLKANEVRQILSSALVIAERTRAQIRRPLGTFGRVTITAVDTRGNILGMVRNRDAPIFGSDVSIQKARTTALLSSTDAADFLRAIPKPASYLDTSFNVKEEVSLGSYADRAQAFIGPQALTDGTAITVRAISNLHRPYFPDGKTGNDSGPFSKPNQDGEWSVFSTGLQLDLSFNNVIQHVLFAAAGAAPEVGLSCNDAPGLRIANGLQIFASSVPIYRGGVLVGGLGVAGDGPEQDEMMAFLGLHEAGLELNAAVNNAPPEIRADRLTPMGTRLRYVLCPQRPFRDSDEERVCEGK